MMIMELITLVIEVAILAVLIDDVYGFSNLRRISQRRIRKFLRDSTKYFKKRMKKTTDAILLHESHQ